MDYTIRQAQAINEAAAAQITKAILVDNAELGKGEKYEIEGEQLVYSRPGSQRYLIEVKAFQL